MPRWISQTRRERTNVRAKQEFGRAIQGVSGGNILSHTCRKLLLGVTQIQDERPNEPGYRWGGPLLADL